MVAPTLELDRTLNESAAPGNAQDELTEAVQRLNALAQLKAKVQETKGEALEVWQVVEQLFSDDPMDEAQIAKLKDGFKVLKSFAQLNSRFTQARAEGEAAREVLDRALGKLG